MDCLRHYLVLQMLRKKFIRYLSSTQNPGFMSREYDKLQLTGSCNGGTGFGMSISTELQYNFIDEKFGSKGERTVSMITIV